ncbi:MULTISPECIES: hypothetical protein [Actinomadura]|uniref:Uncharacterized protein n=1 Tax=Actinomadura yumaensis TaxID=111807 RepID=A0ABW2CFV5_9ACTN|nr:hypothetical protein [Actinomadura sp. J1-007]MWK34524.1 hypothetical protein [Actinomadura sp. J1-007]
MGAAIRYHHHGRRGRRVHGGLAVAAAVAAAASLGTVAPAATAERAAAARASRAAATVKINSAKAEGKTKTAIVNVTYTCTDANGLGADVALGSSVAHGAIAPTCDGKAKTTDIRSSAKYTVLRKGDKVTVTATLVKYDLFASVNVVNPQSHIQAQDSKAMTLA